MAVSFFLKICYSICLLIKKWTLFHHISLPHFWFLWNRSMNRIEAIAFDNDYDDEEEKEQFVFRFRSFQEFSTIPYQEEEQEGEGEEKDMMLCEGDFGVMEKLGPEMGESELGRIRLEPTSHNTNQHNSGFLSEQDIAEKSDINECPITEPNQHISGLGEPSNLKLESLLEHRQLIDQLTVELRKIRPMSLPTILEEPESPLNVQTPEKKLKIDNGMVDFHHFYKSYTEAMRQFDILNYQKMYAMGFLQLKDHFKSTPNGKASAPALKSIVSHNLWLFKHKSHGSKPLSKLINELQGDLEVVYVGQTCITWEFLHWQYMKALNLWNTDPQGIHRYNQVAMEFQQFRVLIQRFIEEEPFQGPRVESYVKSRCVHRSLLQVPVIREDHMNEGTRFKYDKDENGITARKLVEIIEESIRIFWRFLQCEKEPNKEIANLYNPQDLKLLIEVRKTLLKKERRARNGKCVIMRKLGTSRGKEWDEAVRFLWRVDLKLVGRALRMARITREQLVWCRNKMSRIGSFSTKSSSSGDELFIEPCLVLFPC